MKIAVDAMGGDHAPAAIVQGCLAALAERKDFTLVLLGREPEIIACMGKAERENIEIVHTSEVISNEEKPLMAIRRKRASSLARALIMLRDEEVDAVVTAGNTGAFMAGASLLTGRIAGISKPALAPIFPTNDGRGVIALDIGSTMDPKPENLVQFAIMGELYAKTVFGRKKPRIGLLNIGVEAEKGNELTRKTYQLLQQCPDINFCGNVEARDVMAGLCEVLICDGFTGNVLLKAMEGTAQAIFAGIKEAVLGGSVAAKLGALLLKPALNQFRAKMDYAEHGGAPLLGINGVCIKCHGSANATTVKNSILKQAAPLARDKVIHTISEKIGGV